MWVPSFILAGGATRKGHIRNLHPSFTAYFDTQSIKLRRSPLPATSDLAIIGAGPIGLEAASRAALAGLNVVVFEKEAVGHHLSQWGHVRLFSPFRLNHSQWGLELIKAAFPKLSLPQPDSYPTGAEMVDSYLKPLARTPQLSGRILEGTAVRSVGTGGLGQKGSPGQPGALSSLLQIAG